MRGQEDGQAEVWLPLSLFEEMPWVDWDYATEALRLGPGPGELPHQLALPLEGRWW